MYSMSGSVHTCTHQKFAASKAPNARFDLCTSQPNSCKSAHRHRPFWSIHMSIHMSIQAQSPNDPFFDEKKNAYMFCLFYDVLCVFKHYYWCVLVVYFLYHSSPRRLEKKKGADCATTELNVFMFYFVINCYFPDTPWDCHICRSVGVVWGVN